MNADAISDLILAVVAFSIAFVQLRWRSWTKAMEKATTAKIKSEMASAFIGKSTKQQV